MASGATAESLVTADAFLKEHYPSKDVNEQMISKTPFLDQVEKTAVHVDATGRRAVVPLWLELPQGTGARDEGGALPEAEPISSIDAIVTLRHLYQGVRLSGQLIEASQTAVGSFVNQLKFQMKAATMAAKFDQERQIVGNGKGTLCTVTAVAGTTFTANSASALRNIKIGMKVEFFDTAGLSRTANANKPKVTAINKSTLVVTTDTTLTTGTAVVANDEVFRFGNRLKETLGLKELVDNAANDNGGTSATVLGVSCATNPVWEATVLKAAASGTGPLTLDLMQDLVSEIELQDGATPNILLGGVKVRDEYVKLVQADKRFVNTMTLDGGWKVVEFNGLGFVTSPVAESGKLYGITSGDFAIHTQTGWKWMDRDGPIWSRVPGYDQYEAMLYNYMNFASYRRNRSGVLINITE